MSLNDDLKNTFLSIIDLAKSGKIIWSKHILIRMQQRDIKVKQIIDCIMTGRIIEFYPDDLPFPSYLVLGKSDPSYLHVVCAFGENKLWMITAYYPNNDEWHDDFSTRRK